MCLGQRDGGWKLNPLVYCEFILPKYDDIWHLAMALSYDYSG